MLNLSAFETFFPEKRPFFVEGSQVFDFGSAAAISAATSKVMSGVLFATHRARADGRRLATDNVRLRRRS